MRLRFLDDGLVDGGIECSSGVQEAETVYDLTHWIKSQFQQLYSVSQERKNSGKKKTTATTSVLIGNVQMPFAIISAHGSKFQVFCVHPDIYNSPDWSLESTDVDKISAYVANKAAKVDDLDWKLPSNTN